MNQKITSRATPGSVRGFLAPHAASLRKGSSVFTSMRSINNVSERHTGHQTSSEMHQRQNIYMYILIYIYMYFRSNKRLTDQIEIVKYFSTHGNRITSDGYW